MIIFSSYSNELLLRNKNKYFTYSPTVLQEKIYKINTILSTLFFLSKELHSFFSFSRNGIKGAARSRTRWLLVTESTRLLFAALLCCLPAAGLPAIGELEEEGASPCILLPGEDQDEEASGSRKAAPLLRREALLPYSLSRRLSQCR